MKIIKYKVIINIFLLSLLKSPICDFLNLTHPIIHDGMVGVTTPDLVAAVSNTGGLGKLVASSMTP